MLYRQSALALNGWIALTVAALIIFAIANYFPVASLTLRGTTVHASLLDALVLTWQQGHELVAVMTGLFGFVMPLLQLFFLLWALQAIATKNLPDDFRYGMRLLHAVASWSMIPVLMLGLLVAIVKLAGMALLVVGPGLWAFGILTFLMTGLSRVSAHRLWRYAEDAGLVAVSHDAATDADDLAACLSCGFVQSAGADGQKNACGRCGAAIHKRKPEPFTRTWALAIAATILYIPANVLPVMHIRTPLESSAHTILGGVIELWRLNSWGLAVIVFVASVVVPMTKLLALMLLMARHKWRGPVLQRQRTRLYEFIEFIGQWSMLDVFVVIFLTAMADFPGLTQVIAGPGAASFGMVVILTMFAAKSYDPRTGWDAARQAGHARRHASMSGVSRHAI